MTPTDGLALDAYRDAVSLDQEWTPPSPAPPEQYHALVGQAVRHLEGEAAHGHSPALPHELARLDPRSRLRALLTVRPPLSLAPAVQEAIDRILQADSCSRPRVEADTLAALRPELEPTGTRLVLWQGDITTLAVDAIVNAANQELLGCFRPFHACIDNAIHSAAGPRLREDCARIIEAQGHPEPTGTAKATRGYNLPAPFVLHTVGPVVRGTPTPEQQAELASCYRACLDVTHHVDGLRSVAFCGISTGVFGYPRVSAARTALHTVRRWLGEHPERSDLIVFNVFTDEDRAAYEAVLGEGDERG